MRLPPYPSFGCRGLLAVTTVAKCIGLDWTSTNNPRSLLCCRMCGWNWARHYGVGIEKFLGSYHGSMSNTAPIQVRSKPLSSLDPTILMDLLEHYSVLDLEMTSCIDIQDEAVDKLA
ncbi:uncharacterized protein ATNIH1004_000412 [Aspergillus tanneri]|uniref:Uncharacterized protein n=1 Tax=Aspergillus tanneri TaxID=1220188 RepID=A0A5M9N1N2_9EURO|nr:uncharacterized protein ATNIH1004_000412 [Aspergillus tanneri]KAA8651524.1 hypothetical protein ATNIH1004_000412 [Aspergillus tanneri]